MSNQLTIKFTKFTDLDSGTELFGYVAHDNYAEITRNSWGSIDQLLAEIPTEEAAIKNALSHNEFKEYDLNEGYTDIHVSGHPATPGLYDDISHSGLWGDMKKMPWR